MTRGSSSLFSLTGMDGMNFGNMGNRMGRCVAERFIVAAFGGSDMQASFFLFLGGVTPYANFSICLLRNG